MSVSRVTELKFPICSGDMYSGVPAIEPATVTPGVSYCLAMPKSITLSTPSSVTKKLSGLTSRCTTPASCAACRPWHACIR